MTLEEPLHDDEDFEEEEELVQPILKERMNEIFERNGWSSRHFLSRGIPHTSILALRNPHKRVGEKLLTKVAEVLDMPVQTIMEWAEIVPSATEAEQRRRHLVHIYENAAEEQRQKIYDFALFINKEYPPARRTQPPAEDAED